MAPGIETQAHVDGWAKVADAVHEDGGRIVMQDMHGGRESHSELTGTGRVVAPSAIAGPDPIRVPSGKVDAPIPHVLELDEIETVVEGFARAALNAVRAGLDGVQIHGANGYLLAEAVGVGRAVLANPDLARRWRDGKAENAPDLDSFYVGGARGYTDYPTSTYQSGSGKALRSVPTSAGTTSAPDRTGHATNSKPRHPDYPFEAA